MRVALVLLVAARTASADCTVAGDATLAKVTVKTATQTFEVGVRKAASAITISPTRKTIAVADAIAFTGVITQQLWLATKDRYVDGQITFEHGANLVVDHATGTMLVGRGVLHARDVMEGEAKNPDEAVSEGHVPCNDVALEWTERADAATAGTGTYYETRRGSSLVLHRSANDSAPSITIVGPNCSGGGCLWLEEVAKKPGWIELAASNEGVAAVGWVRAGSVARIPSNVAVGYEYGCEGDHEGNNMMFLGGPTKPEHRVQIAVGTGLFTAPGGEAWAIVNKPATFTVRYAPGDTSAEVIAIPNIDLRLASAYVPVVSVKP